MFHDHVEYPMISTYVLQVQVASNKRNPYGERQTLIGGSKMVFKTLDKQQCRNAEGKINQSVLRVDICKRVAQRLGTENFAPGKAGMRNARQGDNR